VLNISGSSLVPVLITYFISVLFREEIPCE